MSSLVIDTGVESHPQISIDSMNFQGESITFRWIGGPYAGDCSEPFTLSLAEHGDMTVQEVVDAITAEMLSKLQQEE